MRRRFLLKYGAALLVSALSTGPASAEQRIVRIDATNGVDDRVLAEYRTAVIGNPRDRYHRKIIHIYVSARHGFDAGWLQVPGRRRVQNVRVVIHVRRGSTLRDPISINLINVGPRTIKHINQQVKIRG